MKISNLSDLREEKFRLKLQLANQEEKLAAHYRQLGRQLEPVAVLLDGVSWFSSDKEKGSSRAWIFGLVGTILQIGLPVIISRLFQKKPAEGSWWLSILQVLGSVIDKDIIKMVVDSMVNQGNEPENSPE